MTDPLPQLRFGEPWIGEVVSRSNSSGRLILRRRDNLCVTVELHRCVQGRLRNAYPVGRHDVEVQIHEASTREVLTAALDAVVTAIRDAEPECRRIVYAVANTDASVGTISTLATIAAVEAAGFRYVVDIDIADSELSLLVAEPEWVTRVDMDLDRVPNT